MSGQDGVEADAEEGGEIGAKAHAQRPAPTVQRVKGGAEGAGPVKQNSAPDPFCKEAVTLSLPKIAPPELPPSAAEIAAAELASLRQDPEAIRRAFETGKYPYKQKLVRKDYEKQKAELQLELLKVQDWVKAAGQEIVILFEGRDAAGKGGTI